MKNVLFPKCSLFQLCMSAGERQDRWEGKHRTTEANAQQCSRKSVLESESEAGCQSPSVAAILHETAALWRSGVVRL